MSATYFLEEDRSGGAILSIHFDVPENHIALETFVATADSAWKVIEALNESYLQGAIEYQLFVLPPEGGTFLSRLGIWSRAGATFLAGALVEPTLSGIIKSLTGHEPTYWAEQATTSLVETVSSIEDNDNGPSSEEKRQRRESKAECDLIVELTAGFLSKSTEELERSGIRVADFPAGFQARNDFYGACIDNARIRAIGFSRRQEFPIPRAAFEGMRVQVPSKDEESSWKIQITSVRVTSPNWDRSDRKRRWKGKDALGRERLFTIEDESFWRLAQLRQLNVSVEDCIGVQWAFQEDRGRLKSFRVLRVLKYNDIELAEPLSAEALEAMLGNYEFHDGNGEQLDLFLE